MSVLPSPKQRFKDGDEGDGLGPFTGCSIEVVQNGFIMNISHEEGEYVMIFDKIKEVCDYLKIKVN